MLLLKGSAMPSASMLRGEGGGCWARRAQGAACEAGTADWQAQAAAVKSEVKPFAAAARAPHHPHLEAMVLAVYMPPHAPAPGGRETEDGKREWAGASHTVRAPLCVLAARNPGLVPPLRLAQAPATHRGTSGARCQSAAPPTGGPRRTRLAGGGERRSGARRRVGGGGERPGPGRAAGRRTCSQQACSRAGAALRREIQRAKLGQSESNRVKPGSNSPYDWKALTMSSTLPSRVLWPGLMVPP
jgi:hypothetical protein